MHRAARWTGMVLTAGAAVLSSCSRAPIALDTADNRAATRQLAEALRHRRMEILSVEPEALVLRYENENYVLEPRMLPRGVDRLIVKKVYRLRVPDAAGLNNLVALLADINRHYNMAQFLLDPGTNLVIQSQVTFLDRLPAEELEAFLEFSKVTTAMVFTQQPDLYRYIQ